MDAMESHRIFQGPEPEVLEDVSMEWTGSRDVRCGILPEVVGIRLTVSREIKKQTHIVGKDI
jgi:hypothetical protein